MPGETERLGAMERAFQKLLSSKSKELPPIIVFQDAKNHADFVCQLARLSNITANDVYVIQTEANNPDPLPLDKRKTYQWMELASRPTNQEREQMWNWLVYEFNRLGIKKVLVAGMELYAPTKENAEYGGCLGSTFNELKNFFDVEITALTWPGKRK